MNQKPYKLLQELYKDNDWRIGLTFSNLHKRHCLSVWKRTNNRYAHRRGVFINGVKNGTEYVYFVTTELNSNITVNKQTEAKQAQWRNSITGVQKELDCKIITQDHLEALKAMYLMESIGGRVEICFEKK